ncbi:hypothetical protein C1N80_06370 [Brachybacterium sp. SGAir0954]|uniref:hypothetical protein n=1 Tax=Brachybacterium sp. SGAir0954 TaxID=2571029 RepID=UPI0010CD201A|nr:hypothetical protein [Brachybacterium sp. SGAir0954]QCR53245.1 hypothetical protein C1N80_06370 [Brachybacterium sp. SGAir0954]
MTHSKRTLQDVARLAADRNGGKGGRALQRIAESRGLTLSYATVDRILAGKYESRPQRNTIEALAVLSELPLEEVYEAAGIPLPMAPFSEQVPEGADRLTVDQRRVVLDVIRGFVRDNDRMADLERRIEDLAGDERDPDVPGGPVSDGATTRPSDRRLKLLSEDAPEGLKEMPYAADEQRPGDDPGEDQH